MIIAFNLLATLIILLVINEFFRKFQFATYVVLIPVLIGLSFLWAENPNLTLFKWAKVYSASAGVILFTLIRGTKLKDKQYIMYAVYGILAINIAEAVLKDFFIFEVSSVLNAITGIILIYTMRGIKNIKVEGDDLIWRDLDWGWIAVYTIWNILVVLGKDAPLAGRYTILLMAPIIAEYFKRGIWLQARALTLSVMLIYGFTFPNFAAKFNIDQLENTTLKLVIGIIGLLCGLTYCYKQSKHRRSKEISEVI